MKELILCPWVCWEITGGWASNNEEMTWEIMAKELSVIIEYIYMKSKY